MKSNNLADVYKWLCKHPFMVCLFNVDGKMLEAKKPEFVCYVNYDGKMLHIKSINYDFVYMESECIIEVGTSSAGYDYCYIDTNRNKDCIKMVAVE